MLSKLRYFSSASGEAALLLRNKVDISPALVKMEMTNARVQRINTGTLSAAFIAINGNQRRFFKTHLTPSGKDTLLKESTLLSALYQSVLDVQCIEIRSAAESRIWLAMNILKYPQTAYSIDQVRCSIDAYNAALLDLDLGELVPNDESLVTLVAEARMARINLSTQGFLSADISHQLDASLSLIESQIGQFAPCLCHGDLGPKNLMSAGGPQPLVIDWEDAFWGIEGYDLLFWFTFFSNRKYYSRDMFGHTPLGKPLEVAMLAMILLLKSELSFRDQTYLENALTFNQRIKEVFDIGD